MKELLDKISSYNIFNYLFPGVLFAFIADELTSFTFVQKDIFIGAFLYYFFGLIISRVGSLFLEPVLRKLSFVKFASYEEFVSASRQDEKIEILSENNNMFRTLCSLFLSIVVVKIYEILAVRYQVSDTASALLIIAFLFVLFLFSYRKQTQYIAKRVTSVMNRDD